MPILIHSFDHDGCLAFSNERRAVTVTQQIEDNQAMIGYLLQYNDLRDDESGELTYPIRKVMIGSNRQSFDKDAANAMRNHNGSCVPLAIAMSEQLDAEFDGLTLADIKAGQSAGHHADLFLAAAQEASIDTAAVMSFPPLMAIHNLTTKECNPYYFHDFDFAEDKINILYAQMHHQAALHPDEEITFNFYDDRLDILRALHNFFQKYPTLIPHNVELSLFHYERGSFHALNVRSQDELS